MQTTVPKRSKKNDEKYCSVLRIMQKVNDQATRNHVNFLF